MNERRRRLLATVGATLSVGITGCSGDGGSDGDSGDDTPTATDTATETGATTPMETDTPTATATAGDGDGGDDTPTATDAPTPTGTPDGAVDLVIETEGFSAWVLAEDESDEVGPTGESNPTMTFAVGTRYAVENNGWDTHPFALRAADDSPLLSQSADGSHEDDEAVDWVDDGETFAFTMTEDLAADLDYYICTVHSSMRGGADAN